MSNKIKGTRISPKLQFPEFRKESTWHEIALENAILPVIREKKKPSNSYTGLGIRSHGKGTFLKISEDPSKNVMDVLYEVQKNDLIVNITFAWEGAIAIAKEPDSGALVSHRFPTFTFNREKAIPDFFQSIIIDKQFIYKLGVFSPGGAGRNRVLNKNDFLKLKILLPNIKEQQKIADCLTSIDDLIYAESQKLEELKDHKKGLMQNLLTAEDEESPKLRFPQFQNKSAWLKRNFAEILTEHKSKSTGTEEVFSVSVHKGLINQIEHLGRSYAAATTDHYRRVLPGDIVYTKSPTGNFPLGVIKQSKIKYPVIVSPLYGVFTPETYALGTILNAYFESPINVSNYLTPIVKKGAKNTINITNTTFLSRALFLPTDKEEQQKIADCFTSFDNLIITQSYKIEVLKLHKKGLIQQLFPSANEVVE